MRKLEKEQWAFLDNYRGTFRWHICFNFVVLRMISFGLDYHWTTHNSHFDEEREELGRDPILFELFIRIHRRKGTNEFVDHRSADLYEDYMRIKLARSSQASTHASDGGDIGETSQEIDETVIWLKVVGG